MNKMIRHLHNIGVPDELMDKVDCDTSDRNVIKILTETLKSSLAISGDMVCKVLRYDGHGSFITSDDPVILYNPFLEKYGKMQYGLSAMGVILILPISPYYAIILYDGEIYKVGNRKDFIVVFSNTTDLQWINTLIAMHADKVVFYQPNTVTESDLLSLAQRASQLKLDEDTGLQSYLSEDGRSEIIHAYSNNIYVGAHFSFLKTLDKARGIHFPSMICAADYSRPYCNELLKTSPHLFGG